MYIFSKLKNSEWKPIIGYLYMANIVFTNWFLFQVEIKKNCY